MDCQPKIWIHGCYSLIFGCLWGIRRLGESAVVQSSISHDPDSNWVIVAQAPSPVKQEFAAVIPQEGAVVIPRVWFLDSPSVQPLLYPPSSEWPVACLIRTNDGMDSGFEGLQCLPFLNFRFNTLQQLPQGAGKSHTPKLK